MIRRCLVCMFGVGSVAVIGVCYRCALCQVCVGGCA